ncbi:serine/threonine-protein kinase [Azospirillum halopraeferens]|uniref:serine/threonine-protein kinase n=1 Tax=Azospirillum halopraeferens TaxID=34010 RepID=UPI00048C439D|nr:serine/threonine-protein kinase [Azospirillum halopraeferens]
MRLTDTTPPRIGPYRVVAPLGEGAMSTVYRGEAPDGGAVALKLLRGDLLASTERAVVLARFRREAEIGRRLAHPHIVRVLDHGEWLGSPYLVMELAEGRDLKHRMETGGVAPDRAIALMGAVLDALAHAHALGIVHRDVKPANIMVDDALVPKVMDFGIAQIPRSDITGPGDLLGTPAYIAPELLHGRPADARSDLFSAGVVLYALLTRRRPFSGSVAEVMQKILFDAPPPPSAVAPHLPPAVDAVVMTALEKDPARRYPGAAAFRSALDAAAAAFDADATLAGVTLIPAATATGAPAAADALRARIAALAAVPLSEKELAGIARLLDDALAAPARPGLRAAVVEDGVVPLAALVAAAMPAPGAGPGQARDDWMRLVRLLARLGDAADRLDGGEDAAAAIDAAVFEVQSAVQLYADRLSRLLMAGDEPDLGPIAADFLRLDVLLLALETLGAERELRAARGTLNLFANQVMRKVNLILADALAGTPDDGLAAVPEGDEAARAAARFGVALVLARVEELLAIAGRLSEAGDALRLRAVGDAVIAEFIGHARRLTALTVAELRAEAAAGADARAFAGRLGMLAALYAFATRLHGAAEPAAAALALTEELHAGVRALLDAVAAAPPGDRDGTLRVAAVHDMAERLGWAEIRIAAVAVLRRRLVAG